MRRPRQRQRQPRPGCARDSAAPATATGSQTCVRFQKPHIGKSSRTSGWQLDQHRRRRPSAAASAQPRAQRQVVDRVPGQHLRRADVRRAGLARAQRQLGVLARRQRRVVEEAADPLEQLARVDDVAGLRPRHRRDDPLRVRPGAVGVRLLVGVRQRHALDDRAGVGLRRGQRALQPVGRRAAVVVGEDDERRGRGAPAGVAQLAARWARRVGVEAQRARLDRVVAQQPLGLAAVVGVVGDDHLEPLARQRLLLERVQQPAQPQRAVVRGDDDGDRGAHAAAIMRSAIIAPVERQPVAARPAR